MPSARLYEPLAPWGDVVSFPCQITIAAGGAVTSATCILPPNFTVAKTGTGQYTVTNSDGPYFQCVGVFTCFDQPGTQDSGLEVMGRVPAVTNGLPAQSFILTTTAAGSSVNVTNAVNVSAMAVFRKSPVP